MIIAQKLNEKIANKSTNKIEVIAEVKRFYLFMAGGKNNRVT